MHHYTRYLLDINNFNTYLLSLRFATKLTTNSLAKILKVMLLRTYHRT